MHYTHASHGSILAGIEYRLPLWVNELQNQGLCMSHAENYDINEGEVRRLTRGEIDICKKIYGEYIDYYKVWVHDESYFLFGLQSPRYAMSPNGELYFRYEHYSADYSITGSAFDTLIAAQHTFVHEMCHVWQYQHGMSVRLNGLLSWAANYHYDLFGQVLSNYSMEQQASIVADYYVLITYGLHQWSELAANNYRFRYDNLKFEEIVQSYESVLSHFPAGD